MSKTPLLPSLLVCTLLFVTSTLPGDAAPPSPLQVIAQADSHCPALPLTGNIVNVSNVSALISAVNGASPGDTILIADGTYPFGSGDYLRVAVPNVTIRSASGNRNAVVLDGNYQADELVQIVASNVTIADLTLREAYYHHIHVTSTSGGDTLNTLIYNLHIVDPGQQAIKINPYTQDDPIYFADDGTVACSHIELTDAGRPQVWNINGSCYTGGMDAHRARGWTIRDNLIEGFWCENDVSEHGIHLWTGSRDTVVERNVLIDNARGIGFGLGESPWSYPWRTYSDVPCPGADYVGHYGGLIRNNFVYASRSALFSSEYGFDCGICLEQACGAQVLHNTVASTAAPASSSIEWRWSNTVVTLTNNLASHSLVPRNGATASLAGNLDSQPLTLFVDGAGGDLHLVPAATVAIDQGVAVAAGLCDDDVDGDARPIGSARDIGADEYGVPPPAAVTDLRVTTAITSTGTLTATLRWTAPANAVTTTLRYSTALIVDASWASAILLTDTLSGTVDIYTATVPYVGDTTYFALESQNVDGASGLSNNAFWPHWDVFLPVTMKGFH